MVIIKSELVIDDGDSVEVPVTFPEELSAAGTGHSTVSEEPLSFVSGRNAQRPIDVKHVSRRLAKMRERLSNSHGFQVQIPFCLRASYTNSGADMEYRAHRPGK